MHAAAYDGSEESSLERSVELAKRAFALRKYEEAVDHYASALELMLVTMNIYNGLLNSYSSFHAYRSFSEGIAWVLQ